MCGEKAGTVKNNSELSLTVDIDVLSAYMDHILYGILLKLPLHPSIPEEKLPCILKSYLIVLRNLECTTVLALTI